ncbi:Rieske 2Fe-2S domain-containing protein [Anaeromyxobacter sp. PSR-1]|uniref:Rieske (2Fe-2S) protein n=1 Tax=Anaeromyxobacter sp. PSR-1 TaxID=1300915 RepID=UPI0007512C32|nr:Rieske 2Fe-2S domain-containing protein [Anaeromyxobacter sp. PSR-1]
MRHRVGRLQDLPDGHGWLVEIEGQEIALFRRGERVHALDNVCPHRGAALAFGDVRGEVVYCPLHAWPFQLATGACPEFPEASVRTFPVHVGEGGDLELEL